MVAVVYLVTRVIMIDRQINLVLCYYGHPIELLVIVVWFESKDLYAWHGCSISEELLHFVEESIMICDAGIESKGWSEMIYGVYT